MLIAFVHSPARFRYIYGSIVDRVTLASIVNSVFLAKSMFV